MRSPKLIASGTATINMTPMIDIVFLLIIFFLVSSHLSKQENAIELKLPTAQSGLEDPSVRDTVVLPDGQWMLAGVPVHRAGLESALRRRAALAADALRLKIRTDQSVPYEKIEPILSVAAAQGIGDIVFSVYGERSP
jgi:biopolymer transport protein ExbD